MKFGQAFIYPFRDNAWGEKLILTALMAALSLVPVFGLIALAGLLGYMLMLTDNVRRRAVSPLPRWTRLSDMIGSGAQLLGALVVYNLPNLLLVGFTLTILSLFPRDPIGSLFSLALLCCMLPLMLVYTLVAWSALAVGVVRYAENGNPQTLYDFTRLLRIARAQMGAVAQWVIGALLVNLALLALLLLPCLGWAAILTLAIPWHGHMLGQFALRLAATERTP